MAGDSASDAKIEALAQRDPGGSGHSVSRNSARSEYCDPDWLLATSIFRTTFDASDARRNTLECNGLGDAWSCLSQP